MAERGPAEPWLSIIGMGADGPDSLSAKAKLKLDDAEILVSSPRLFAMIPSDDRPRIMWQSPFADSLQAIEAQRPRKIAVIATGDPLCYGVGNWLLTRFPLDEMVIIPGVSAFALACARMGWPQHRVVLHTLHGRDENGIRSVFAPQRKLIVLSEDATTPKKVCTHLVEQGYERSKVSVFTHLDGQREHRFDVIAGEGADVFDAEFEANQDFNLNTMAIDCVAASGVKVLSSAPGLPDELFSEFRKMTKRELRALAISRLAPLPDDIMWDVGAGSASIAVEFLRLAPGGAAYTFDIDAKAQAHQHENASRFGLSGLHAGHRNEMPLQSGDLAGPPVCPRPNAIFMGGGISRDKIDAALQFLLPGGRFVCHAVTIESEADLFAAQRRHGGSLSRISVARLQSLGSVHGFKPAMTITQWAWQKEDEA